MTNTARPAHYGFDAPGVTKGFFVVAAFLLAFGLILLGWHVSQLVVIMGCVLFTLSFVPLALGVAMVAYFLRGKVRTRDMMLGSIPWTGLEHVLDIGTGAGLLAIGAAKKLNGGAVIGIDIWSERDLSNNQQSVTLQNVAGENVSDKVTIQTGDARSLDFEDGSFDRVVSLLCLHNIEDKQEQHTACIEIARVLKAGGFAVIGDYLPTGNYARSFKEAGMTIIREQTAFTTALALMWILVAEKPLPNQSRGY